MKWRTNNPLLTFIEITHASPAEAFLLNPRQNSGPVLSPDLCHRATVTPRFCWPRRRINPLSAIQEVAGCCFQGFFIFWHAN